ncbi:MAG: response regulator transcription factor [Cryobacterium sp.]|nr:response regulator transcription factor [Oligoflexia bacterium]
MKTLLLVEDDISLGATLKERLEKEGYSMLWSKTVAQAEKDFKSKPVDLVILDVGLPDGSGFELAETIRRAGMTPFLFLTAQAGAPERLRGFELGAEEFIPKPFHLKEILMRVKHVLENHAVLRKVNYGKITIDFERMAVTRADGVVEALPVKDFQLLRYLVSVSPRVVSRDEILDSVWGEENFPSNRTVDNAIVRLRQVIEHDGHQWIQSVRGVGYQWVGPQK